MALAYVLVLKQLISLGGLLFSVYNKKQYVSVYLNS